MNSDIAMLTIIHDENGLIREPLKKALPIFRDCFKQKYVAVSDQTPEDVRKLLEARGLTRLRLKRMGRRTQEEISCVWSNHTNTLFIIIVI